MIESSESFQPFMAEKAYRAVQFTVQKHVETVDIMVDHKTEPSGNHQAHFGDIPNIHLTLPHLGLLKEHHQLRKKTSKEKHVEAFQ